MEVQSHPNSTVVANSDWTVSLVAFKAADAALDACARKAVGMGPGPALAALDAEVDTLVEARTVAYDDLLATPPVDAAGLALKMLLHSRECDDRRVGFTDPEHAQDACYAVLAAQGSAQFFRDMLGLAALAA